MSIYIWDTEVKDVYLWANKLNEVYVWDTKVFPTMKLTLLAEVIITWDNRVSDDWRYLLNNWWYEKYWEVWYDKLLYEISNYRSNTNYTFFMCDIWYSTRIQQWIAMQFPLFQYLAEWTSWKPRNHCWIWFNNSSWSAVYSWEFRVYWVS